MKSKRNIVGVSRHGRKILLDVDRVIAVDAVGHYLYFEDAIWEIPDDEEFTNVYNAWVVEV